MQIQLMEITSLEGKTEEYQVSLDFDRITYLKESYSVVSKEPVLLQITNTGNKVLKLSGKAKLSVEIPCGRCLTPVETAFDLSFEHELDMKLDEKERRESLDEISYLHGMDLDVDRLVYLEVLMSWPLKVLCKEDCKGICSRCGKNLNEGPCGCTDEPKDPRMAAISDIFRKFKEV